MTKTKVPTTRKTRTTRVTKFWDLIGVWGCHEDIKDIRNKDDNDDDVRNDNNDEKNNNNEDERISALGLHRDLGVS